MGFQSQQMEEAGQDELGPAAWLERTHQGSFLLLVGLLLTEGLASPQGLARGPVGSPPLCSSGHVYLKNHREQDPRAGFSLLPRGLLGLAFPGVSPFPLEEPNQTPSPHHSVLRAGGRCYGQGATWLQARGSPSACPWGFHLSRGNQLAEKPAPQERGLCLGRGSGQPASGAWGEGLKGGALIPAALLWVLTGRTRGSQD